MINTQLLADICRVPGAPGHERLIRKRIIEEITDLVDEVQLDAMGNVLAIKHGSNREKSVMVAAHMDEISFIVTDIDKEGFVRFHTLGGFDAKTLTAQRVIIHGQDHDVVGVMGTKPIHVLTAEERNKAPKTTEFFIDTGYPHDEVVKMIKIGDPITRERELIEMGPCVNAKSLDNRVSVFILIETLRKLKGKSVPYDIIGAFTVQEEVGLRGAMTAASGYDPDFGIALDVTLAYDLPGAGTHEMISRLGQGTAIKVMDGATICDYRMVAYMRSLAEGHGVKHQMEILPAGGTDTAGLQRFAKGGCIAGAISIPTRYLHQVIEMAHKEDIQSTIDLLELSLVGLDTYDWSFK